MFNNDVARACAPWTNPACLRSRVDGQRASLFGIQVLRGIAALMVVFHHYVGTAVERGFAINGLEQAAIGNAGVDMFFVISGFIMEYTLGSRRFRPGDRAIFLMRRMTRILPLYWVLTLTAFLIFTLLPSIVNSSTTVHQLMYSLVLLPDQSVGSYVLPMAWTLTFEFFFYLLFAVMLSLRPRTRLLLLALCFAPSLLVEPTFTDGRPLLGTLLNPILFEFLAGVWLAQLVGSGKSLGWLAGLGMVLSAIAILILEMDINITESLKRLVMWGGPAFLLVGGVVLTRPASENWRPGALARFGGWVGDMSYSLYLSHYFAVAIFAKMYFHYLFNFGVPAWLVGLGLLVFCLLVAHLCYICVERPARIVLNAWFQKSKLQG